MLHSLLLAVAQRKGGSGVGVEKGGDRGGGDTRRGVAGESGLEASSFWGLGALWPEALKPEVS